MMKRLAVVAMAVLAAVTWAPAQTRSTVPFDREGISKLFENERVVLWKGLVGIKSRPTPLHEHQMDLVGVFLDDGGMGKVTLPDGTVRQSGKPTRRGGVLFQPKGVVHVEEQLVDGIRAVAVELKDAAAPAPITAASNVPHAFPRDGAAMLLENDRVAVWDYQWKTGEKLAPAVRGRDAVYVTIESGEVRYSHADGRVRVKRYMFGDVEFVGRGEVAAEEARGGTPRVIVVELK